ncbi:hypothetical protein [Pilimelia columellifera]|uniref:hypothetical protein n=1 Tax=Pilimelia columellifera TaxID=706574 RepID=UPI0031E0957C
MWLLVAPMSTDVRQIARHAHRLPGSVVEAFTLGYRLRCEHEHSGPTRPGGDHRGTNL